MAILNETLDWKQIVTANPKVALAFRGVPTKVLLAQNEMLARLITTECRRLGISGNELFLSPWWTEWGATFALIARFKSVSPRDVVRGKFAVTQEFSRELDSLAQVIIDQPVYAWRGPARHQDDKVSGVTHMGGGTQFYLPNLASDTQGLSSRVAHLHSFTSVDWLTQ